MTILPGKLKSTTSSEMMPFLNRLFICGCLVFASTAVVGLEFSSAEQSLILQHGPWPMSLADDSSNRASGNPAAIRLGERLFFDHQLGADSKLSCASCHDPGQGLADGRVTGAGRVTLTRNTPTLLNLKAKRWFGWGGENDSLWAQSIRPLLAANEMASNPEKIKTLIAGREQYRELYRSAFGNNPQNDTGVAVLVNTGKALAAYQETLISERSDFDEFRDALQNADQDAMSRYPESAQRGLRIFIGAGRCNLCHFGPRFSNGEFADIGIPYFIEGGVDAGRYGGIQQVRANPYNLLGKYNDGDPAHNALSSSQVRQTHRNWGEFKVPGLRGVAVTAPYMHNGSLPTLPDVVNHYSALDEERLHSDGEKILQPLNLTSPQIDDLVSFLRSLGEY
jgi:cytochrome c peroxidase